MGTVRKIASMSELPFCCITLSWLQRTFIKVIEYEIVQVCRRASAKDTSYDTTRRKRFLAKCGRAVLSITCFSTDGRSKVRLIHFLFVVFLSLQEPIHAEKVKQKVEEKEHKRADPREK